MRELIKGLSPKAIFSTSSIELHYYIVHSDSKLQEELFEGIFYTSTPTSWELIKGLSPNFAIFSGCPMEMYLL